jgi:hypothetical protein
MDSRDEPLPMIDWSALGLLAAVDAGLDDGRSSHPST